MTFNKLYCTVLFLFLICLKVNAQVSQEIVNLSKSEQWLALLHVNTLSRSDTVESYVDDESFFIASDGKNNPEQELLATIAAIKQDSEMQCKYPARTRFLLDNINGFSKNLQASVCKEYLDWRNKLNTSNVVLVFASAQLNSPSSMYGHTFLRFDPDDIKQNSTYLSYALNFGATVPEGDGGFFYAAKGLTGGYPGNFAANPYFEKIKEYNRLENRDLWEYELNLQQDEIDDMLAHIWELRGINFAYYFFDENCSFRLLELLDVARPGLYLANNFPVTALPLDTVRVVEEAGLVSSVHYRASILTELEAQLILLTDTEQAIALALSKDINVLEAQSFLSLPKVKQQLVVDSAYRYLRYQNTFNGRPKETTRRSFLLLRRLNKQPVELNIPIKQPLRPDLGHKTSLVAASIGQNIEDMFVEIKYRASYHDLLDPAGGYYQGMSLNMINVMVRAYEGGDIKLEKAELLDIVSLSTRNQYFSPWSWKANISAEQQWTVDKEILTSQGTAGGGVSYQPIENSSLFLFATGRLELNRKLDSFVSIAPGLHTGFLYYWPKSTLLLEAELYQFLFDQTQRSKITFQQSLQLSKNDSLRLSADFHHIGSNMHENKSFQEFKLEYRHYF